MILAGDIGGTKCNLALVDAGKSPMRIVFLRRYPSAQYAQFEEIITEFLDEAKETLTGLPGGKVIAAGFGVAGPVVGRTVRVTNLDWIIDVASLQGHLATPHVALLNDLEATGYSFPQLGESDLCVLNAGVVALQEHAPQALIAAGTGLGESILHWGVDRYVVFPSEGGHADFAPRTEQEIALLRYMKKTDRYVSFELLVSGRGFHTIHSFLNPVVRHASFDEPGADTAKEITALGLQGACATCVETLDLWTSLYGAEAGNLALKALSLGGVFVAGGIGPKILAKMKDGTFVRAFREKEKFEELLSRVPIHMVLNEDAPLLGAAAEAARLLRR